MQEMTWSKAEKASARLAFERAHERECRALASEVGVMLSSFREPRDIWRVHDFLTERRKTTDEKYDYRYSVLVFVLARLLREGWLREKEIAALSEDKMERIRSIAAL